VMFLDDWEDDFFVCVVSFDNVRTDAGVGFESA